MLSLLAQTAVSFVATVSFAILFQVPREQYVYSGLCGAAGWLCYLLVMQNYPSPAVASFAAVVVLTVMSRIFAVRRKTPVTIFWICGIFPLVPGAPGTSGKMPQIQKMVTGVLRRTAKMRDITVKTTTAAKEATAGEG